MSEKGKRGWVDWELFKQIRASMPLASVDILAIHEGRLLLMRRVNEPGRGSSRNDVEGGPAPRS